MSRNPFGRKQSQCKRIRKSKEKITLVFAENKALTINAEELEARSGFVRAGMEFYAGGGQTKKVLKFYDIGIGPHAHALEIYLDEGEISGVNQLNLKDTCTLIAYANEFQIREIENQCLLNVLNCIRQGCFSDEELQEIASIIPFSPELESIIHSITADWNWDENTSQLSQKRCRAIEYSDSNLI